MKLSKTSAKRLEEFDEAAQEYGFECGSDQSSNLMVATAKRNYDDALKALTRRIHYLEKKARRSP